MPRLRIPVGQGMKNHGDRQLFVYICHGLVGVFALVFRALLLIVYCCLLFIDTVIQSNPLNRDIL